MKPIAVIILNWNGEKLLSEFLPSVVEHTPADIADVIVADNGSTDGSRQLLEEHFPTVKTIIFDKNYGFAEGYNKAIKIAGYRYTVLLNSDVAVKNDWLTPLYRFMRTHPDAAAVQPKLLSFVEPGMFEYAGAAGGFLDCNGYPYCRGRIFTTIEEDKGQYDSPMAVDWASGACLMVDSARYNEVGGLDPRFFAHMEEIDLCWRLRLRGWGIYAVPDSRVYHLGGGSLPAGSAKKTYLNFRNSLLMLWKNLPRARRKKVLLRRRLLDTLAWAKFIASADFANAGALLRAHRDFRTMRDAHYKSASPAEADLLQATPLSRLNILKEYYLKRHKKFSQLLPR